MDKHTKNSRKNPDESLKSLAKVVRALECFSINQRSLSVAEICAITGFPRSTTHRLLSSMREVGLLDQDRGRDRYRLGIRLFEFGNIALANLDLHREARPLVDALQRLTNQSVHLAIFDGLRAVVVHRADPPNDSGGPITLTESAPSHCTGVGKAILAFQQDGVIKRVIESGLEKFTDATIVDAEKLKHELELTRNRGFSIDDGEHQPGVRCTGAPIRNQNGDVFAAISVSGPAWQVSLANVDDLSKIVRHHANMISQRMGCSTPENVDAFNQTS